jgi:carbonic anhydrase
MPKWLPYVALVTLSVLALSHYRRVEMPADAAVVAAAQAPAADHASVAVHAHWSYEGPEGPEHWGELDPAYAACAKGTHQTPIDIHDAADADLPPLAIDYKTLGQEVVNNGHTIQVNMAPGSALTLNGVPYELKQFHFHTPSENDIDERPYAMEAHLVHGDRNGHLAVIAVLFQLGAEDSAIAHVFADSPKVADTRKTLTAPVDPNDLLPKGRDYYAFTGSLTTPPCTEGVSWIVLREPLTVSKEEVAFLEAAMHGHNNRPIQPLHARTVLR